MTRQVWVCRRARLALCTTPHLNTLCPTPPPLTLQMYAVASVTQKVKIFSTGHAPHLHLLTQQQLTPISQITAVDNAARAGTTRLKHHLTLANWQEGSSCCGRG